MKAAAYAVLIEAAFATLRGALQVVNNLRDTAVADGGELKALWDQRIADDDEVIAQTKAWLGDD